MRDIRDRLGIGVNDGADPGAIALAQQLSGAGCEVRGIGINFTRSISLNPRITDEARRLIADAGWQVRTEGPKSIELEPRP